MKERTGYRELILSRSPDDASLEAVGGASPAGGEASARPSGDVAQELTRAC